MESKDLKKHLIEELRIVKEVMYLGNTDDKSADWFRAKIVAAQVLIDALRDELDEGEKEDDF